MAGSPSIRFAVTGHAEQAWNRLASSGGSLSDTNQVLEFLGQLWAANSSDPRAFDDWLSDRGIDKKLGPSREVLIRAKKDFETYQRAKREATERLVRGIAVGPNARHFFASLRGYPSELQAIAFQAGLSACADDDLVFFLIALAREGTALIHSCLKDVPRSPITDNFLIYLKTRSIDVRAPAESTSQPTSRTEKQIDTRFLFSLLSLPPSRELDEFGALNSTDVGELVDRVEALFPLLPEEGYGEFVRRKMTYVMYFASPEHPIAENLVPILLRSREVPEADLFPLLGPSVLTALLLGLAESNDPTKSALMASVLDTLRKSHPDVLVDLPHHILRKSNKSRNASLSLSIAAARLRLGELDYADFQSILVRSVKADKQGAAALWLASNAEFWADVIGQKLPGRALTKVLEAFAAQDPERLMRLLRDSLSSDNRLSDEELWDASTRALHRIRNSAADQLFVDLVLRRLQKSAESQQSYLTQEPALSLLARNVWTIAQRTNDERAWGTLLNAAGPRIGIGSILSWLKAPPAKQATLRSWIMESYIPNLFERGLANANFVVELEDLSSQALIIKSLCSRLLSHHDSLKSIATGWPRTRDAEKQKLADQALVGLRIAIRSSPNNNELQGRLAKLLNSVERWRPSESPQLDPSIASAANIAVPEARDGDAAVLNSFFSSRPMTTHDVSLFFATNPWAVDLYLSSHNGSWPKLEYLLERLTESLTFFASLDERSIQSKKDLTHNVKVDFGVAVREGLDEVEEMMSGYFAFRSILREQGLEQAEQLLGDPIDQQDISSDRHKVIRDSSQLGRLRITSLGLKVDGTVVGSSRIAKSGDGDDRN